MKQYIFLFMSLLASAIYAANAVHTVAEITSTIKKYDMNNDLKLGWKEYRKLIQNNIHNRLTRTQWRFVQECFRKYAGFDGKMDISDI